MYTNVCLQRQGLVARQSFRAPNGAFSASKSARKVVAGAFAPPTVSETKSKFLRKYDVPVGAMYNNVIQELLVQQHFMRYNIKYAYDEVFALGVSSVFNQVLDDQEQGKRDAIFDAYITALDEDPEKYRKDSEKLLAMVESCSSAQDLLPDASGSDIQQLLAKIAAKTAASEFFYTRFFAIGLFRLLELTGARDPKALDGLVKALGVDAESVNKDLLLYKGILSKMMAAKELMKEVMDREKRKQKERDAVTAKDDSAAAVPSASS